MAKKRILHKLDLVEISAVTAPCQEGARNVISKRAYTQEERDAMAADGTALPDGSFPIATEADLSNAVRAYGRAKNKAQAKAHIITRAKALGAEAGLPEGWTVNKEAQTFNATLGESLTREMQWRTGDALQDTVRSIVSDDELTADQKRAKIVEAAASYAEAVTKLPLLDGAEAGEPGEPVGPKESPMPDTAAQVADLTKTVEDLAKALEMAQAISKATDAEKAYMDGMSDEDKKAFMALKPEDRKAKMDMSKALDERVTIDGKEFAKSAVGADAFAVLKAQADKLAKAADDAEAAKFAKVAADEYGHLPGEDVAKAQALRAVSKMAETDRRVIETMLKASDAKLAESMTETGHNGDSSASGAYAKLAKAADEIAKRDGISKALAKAKAITENPELRKAYYDEQGAA